MIIKSRESGKKQLPFPKHDFRLSRLFGFDDEKHESEMTIGFRHQITVQNKLSYATFDFWADAVIMMKLARSHQDFL